jgi:hypothetical protein
MTMRYENDETESDERDSDYVKSLFSRIMLNENHIMLNPSLSHYVK